MKRIVKIAAAVIAAITVTDIGAGIAIHSMAISSEGNREAIFASASNQVDIDESVLSQAETEEVSFDETSIFSYDGLKLNGYVIEQDTSIWVIAVHGYTDNGLAAGNLCGPFYHRGYSLLMPDLRGQGKSEGDYIGMGWHDRLDIVSWISYLNETYHNPDIILYGISMGGAACLMTSGEKLPENVRCIISDCAYSSVKEEFEYQGKQLFKIPYYPLIWTASRITKIADGFSFEEASALEQVKKSETPTLIIHGEEDEFVPVSCAYELYDACTGEKELYIVPKAGHAGAMFSDYEKYWNKVFSFTDMYSRH